MYIPSDFSEADSERIETLIGQYGFATLISNSPAGLQITHAAMQFDRKRDAHSVLIGHIARANPHAGLLIDGAEMVVIFHGPHGYISPTWYVDENPGVPNVPTWNYLVVHVRGRVRRIDDAAQKWKIVTALAAQYEQDNARPWAPGELASHAGKLGAIVAFEVVIDTIEAKAKLSQNRSAADQENVIQKLQAGVHPDSQAMAALMRENIARQRKSPPGSE